MCTKLFKKVQTFLEFSVVFSKIKFIWSSNAKFFIAHDSFWG